jgi:hypothetical protein
MALSRLAKKFRELEKKQDQPGQNSAPPASKKAGKATKTVAPVSAKPVEAQAPVQVEPVVVAPVAPPEPPKPGKRSREVVKRPRFVYVPEKAERKTPSAPPAVPTPRSNKLSAKLMTKNLALPPEDDAPASPLGLLRGRL